MLLGSWMSNSSSHINCCNIVPPAVSAAHSTSCLRNGQTHRDLLSVSRKCNKITKPVQCPAAQLVLRSSAESPCPCVKYKFLCKQWKAVDTDAQRESCICQSSSDVVQRKQQQECKKQRGVQDHQTELPGGRFSLAAASPSPTPCHCRHCSEGSRPWPCEARLTTHADPCAVDGTHIATWRKTLLFTAFPGALGWSPSQEQARRHDKLLLRW